MTIIKWSLAVLYTIGILCVIFGNDIMGSWREGIVLFGYATVGFSAFVTFLIALLSYQMNQKKAVRIIQAAVIQQLFFFNFLNFSTMKQFYTRSKAAFFILLVAFSLPFTTHAQTVTQAWAALASTASPIGIAIDASGNVYTTNYNNSTVSKITSAGVVTQSWAALASGASSAGIAISATGNVYTANYGNNTVSKITGAAVVPVELLSFSGKFLLNDKEGSNLLTWQTASEVKNKGFEVERLMVNGEWLIMGFVKAQGKAAIYDFVDNQPLSTSYYRLRQIDNDGKETLSKVISIQSKGKGKALTIYPNPVSNTLTLENTEGVNFQILNLLGQQVLNGKMNGQRLDVSRLPQGTYVLKVGTEVAKFVKQ